MTDTQSAVGPETANLSRQHRIDELVEALAASLIDVEPERCDPEALRLTAAEMLELASLLEAPDGEANHPGLEPVRPAEQTAD